MNLNKTECTHLQRRRMAQWKEKSCCSPWLVKIRPPHWSEHARESRVLLCIAEFLRWQIHTSSRVWHHIFYSWYLARSDDQWASSETHRIPLSFNGLQTRFTRSCTGLCLVLTTRLKRNARPVEPVNRVDTSSLRLVKGVSQCAHEKMRWPPRCSRNTRPIGKIWLSKRNRWKWYERLQR